VPADGQPFGRPRVLAGAGVVGWAEQKDLDLRDDAKAVNLRALAAGADRDRQNSYGISSLALANTIANYDVRKFFEPDH
jgi:hypothetical protein